MHRKRKKRVQMGFQLFSHKSTYIPKMPTSLKDDNEEEEQPTVEDIHVLSEDEQQRYDSNLEEGEEDEDEEEEETSDEDDIDDPDEPKLRYRRVGASVKELLDKDTASTLRVSDKFVV
jgi:hypothetical protein